MGVRECGVEVEEGSHGERGRGSRAEVKLRYARIKTRLKREAFLGEGRGWARRMVRLSGERLEVERGRHRGKRPSLTSSRL